MPSPFIQKLIYGVLYISVPLCTSAAAPKSWDVWALSRSNNYLEALRDSRGAIIRRVNTAQMRFLYSVKSSIEQVSETKVTLLLLDGEQPNAYATTARNGQNIVMVNFAMLDIVGMDLHLMSAIIGHEIAHIRLGHLQAARQRRAGAILLKLAGALAFKKYKYRDCRFLSRLAVDLVETKYSRDDERGADYLGMIWALEAGYEVSGGLRLWEELYRTYHGRVNLTQSFLGSHPTTTERIQTMREMTYRLGRH